MNIFYKKPVLILFIFFLSGILLSGESFPRIIREPVYPQDYNYRMSLYKDWGIRNPEKFDFLKGMPPEIVKHRLEKLKILLEREDAGYFTELLYYYSGDLEDRAKIIDSIEGLQVSYRDGLNIKKVEPLMLTACSETIRKNLQLLQQNNISQVEYPELLYKISNFKLKSNIDFLNSKSIDFSENPNVLFQPTRYIKNNYYILSILNLNDFPVSVQNLNISTSSLISKIKDKIQAEKLQPLLFDSDLHSLPKRTDILLENFEKILEAQKNFYEWDKDNQDKHEYICFRENYWIFKEYDLNNLKAPSYSLFLLTTIAQPNSDFEKALISFITDVTRGIQYRNLDEIRENVLGNYNLSTFENFSFIRIFSIEAKYLLPGVY